MSITETKLTIMNLIEMSKFRGHLGDSDGDFKLELAGDITRNLEPTFSIPVKHLGDSTELLLCEVNGTPAILLQAGSGPSAWSGLYIYSEESGSYKLHGGYYYDWDMTQEDDEFSKLKEMEKVKFLYLKGLHLPE